MKDPLEITVRFKAVNHDGSHWSPQNEKHAQLMVKMMLEEKGIRNFEVISNTKEI